MVFFVGLLLFFASFCYSFPGLHPPHHEKSWKPAKEWQKTNFSRKRTNFQLCNCMWHFYVGIIWQNLHFLKVLIDLSYCWYFFLPKFRDISKLGLLGSFSYLNIATSEKNIRITQPRLLLHYNISVELFGKFYIYKRIFFGLCLRVISTDNYPMFLWKTSFSK